MCDLLKKRSGMSDTETTVQEEQKMSREIVKPSLITKLKCGVKRWSVNLEINIRYLIACSKEAICLKAMMISNVAKRAFDAVKRFSIYKVKNCDINVKDTPNGPIVNMMLER